MKKALTIALLVVASIPMLIAVAAMPRFGDGDSPVHRHVSARYLEYGAAETGTTNIVTAVLLNYRGLDTLGEVTVIFVALASVLAVLLTARTADSAREVRPGAAAPQTATPVSPVALFVVRLLTPFIALFVLYVLLKGDVAPGGGFQAGAILGGLFIVLTVVLGETSTRALCVPALMPWLRGIAVLAFGAVGIAGAVFTGYFLGFPDVKVVQKAMLLTLEFGIALGGAAVFASIFLQMEEE